MKKLFLVLFVLSFAAAAHAQETLKKAQAQVDAMPSNPAKKEAVQKLKRDLNTLIMQDTLPANFSDFWAYECYMRAYPLKVFVDKQLKKDSAFVLTDCKFELIKGQESVNGHGVKGKTPDVLIITALGKPAGGAETEVFKVEHKENYFEWWPKWAERAGEISWNKSFK